MAQTEYLVDLFQQTEVDKVINRINQLSSTTPAKWGKMDVAQMLCHLCVVYDFVYVNPTERPNFFMRFLMIQFVKPMIINTKPYKQSLMTGPQFIIKEDKDFDTEKLRLINYLNRVVQDGFEFFADHDYANFGKMNHAGWCNMFYKHIDHHLKQFGV